MRCRKKARKDQERFQNLLSRRSVMIQPFLSEVLSNGEISLCYFSEQYSHCVRKKPAPGNIKTQQEYGAIQEKYDPGESLIEWANKLVGKYAQKTTYARVDIVLLNGVPHLMELELIEPRMFLSYSKDSPSKFADAILKAYNASLAADPSK